MNMWPDDCDTELCLSPCGRQYNRATRCCDSTGSSRRVESRREKLPQQQVEEEEEEEEEEEGEGEEEEGRPITIFYGDQMCTWDVTEIQARAIICMAKRETEEKAKKEEHFHRGDHRNRRDPHPALPRSSPLLPRPSNALGLSMKQSLQWFLQQRKSRFCGESTSPRDDYHHCNHHHHLPPN